MGWPGWYPLARMPPSANASPDPLATQLTLPLPELNLLPASVRPPPLERRVFCNRNLRLDRIEAAEVAQTHANETIGRDAVRMP